MSYLDNIRTFVRVYELGSMSAAGRDLRVSPAVTSSRISQLEEHLSVRLFQRTTRNLTPTEQGKAFYGGAVGILEAVDSAEAQVIDLTENPKGSLFVAAPLGVGRAWVPSSERAFPSGATFTSKARVCQPVCPSAGPSGATARKRAVPESAACQAPCAV